MYYSRYSRQTPPQYLRPLWRSKTFFFKTLNLLTMKSVTTVLFFLALSARLFAQDDAIVLNSRPDLAYTAKKWQSTNIHFGLNYTNTEGVLKNFITTNFALNFGLEMHKRHIIAFNGSIRPASLNKTFTQNNQVWKSDTSVNLTTIEGLLGLQVWASKRSALYFVGALGAHQLVAGKRNTSSNNNCSCGSPEKKEEWTIESFAPSAGIFYDFRMRASDSPWGYQDHYFRLKFMASSVNFSTIGNGVLYDMGVGYSF
jgi:hypothetical protein